MAPQLAPCLDLIAPLTIIFSVSQKPATWRWGPAVPVQFTQIQQAFLNVAQVRVVEFAGGFLAVARNERHGRTCVEQRDCGRDLMRAYAEFPGDELRYPELRYFRDAVGHGEKLALVIAENSGRGAFCHNSGMRPAVRGRRAVRGRDSL